MIDIFYIFYIQVTNDLNTPIIHTPIIHLHILICLDIIIIFFIKPNILIVQYIHLVTFVINETYMVFLG
jgi:hypothetical protein